MGTDANQTNEESVVFTVAELARYLRKPRNSTYQSIHRGEIPGVVRIGKSFRISRVVIDRWLNKSGPA